MSGRGEEGRWMGYLNLALMVGMGLGPVIGGAVSDTAGFAVVFAVMGVLNLAAFIFIVAFVPESRTAAERKAASGSVRKMLGSRAVWGLAAMAFAFQASYAAMLAFLPLYGADRFRFSAFDVGALLLFNTVALSLLQPLSGWLADRINRWLLTVVGGVINCFALGFLILADSFASLVVLMVLGGIAGALVIPATSALVIVEGRKFGMGSANAAVSVSHSIGVVIGAVMAGIVNDIYGISGVFIFAGLLGIPGIIAFAVLVRYRQAKPG
jgi:predicted MFS family arabinose efflux permease